MNENSIMGTNTLSVPCSKTIRRGIAKKVDKGIHHDFEMNNME
jgi:hypothetical protein